MSFGQVAQLLHGCLHSLRHSMHDLAWRHQQSVQSQQALNEAMLKHLQSMAPPRAPPAAPPRQPSHPPPESVLGRKAPVAEPATEPLRPTPKLQPRVTNAVKPPLQNPRTRIPPPAVNRPNTPPPANSQQANAAPVKGQRLLCPKPNTGVPAAKPQPRAAGRPKTDCHLHCFLVVIQQSCSLHCL